MRARRDDPGGASFFERRDVLVRQLLKHVLVAGPLGGIAVAALLRKHAEGDPPRAQDVGERSDRLLKIGLECARTAEPDEPLVPAGIKGFEPGRLYEFVALLLTENPDATPPLEIVEEPAEVARGVAVRHQTATRPDDQRHMLDAD